MAEEKFFRRGKTQVLWLPTIASGTLAPTSAEIAAGSDLTQLLHDVKGFSFANKGIPVPNMASSFTGSIPGEDTAADSTLGFYLQKTTNPLRATLAKGTAGFVVLCDYKIGAIVAADKVDVWNSTVAAIPKQYSLGNDPALWDCEMTHGAVPGIDLAVLA